MKNKWSYTSSPAFLPLLTLFFVFHGYVDFFDLVTPETGIQLILQYLLASFILWILCRILFNSWARAALLAFCLMAINFFFGSFQDGIRKYFHESFADGYRFQLGFLFLFLAGVFILLKKQKQVPFRLIRFLNLLFPLLLLLDTASLLIKIKNRRSDPTVGNRAPLKDLEKNADRPDIFFIITDGYSGDRALQQFMQYDNSSFENELRQRGFFVADSSFSNYNYTVFSVASTLSMDYLRADGFFNGKTDLPRAFKALRDNPTTAFFEKQGYEIHNYSIFDIKGHPTSLFRTLLQFDKSPLTTQTLVYRTWKDIGYHLVFFLGLKKHINEITLTSDLKNNLLADSLTRALTEKPSASPRFVYTHLVMPHAPYYFDSLGKQFPLTALNDATHSDKGRYINYLAYTNKKLLSLVDHITRNNKRPPIIVLLGDHGCRDCLQNMNEAKAQSLNLNAILLPENNYTGFYKGMSSVNEFRLIMNSSFKQSLPLIKDSSVHIKVNEALLH